MADDAGYSRLDEIRTGNGDVTISSPHKQPNKLQDFKFHVCTDMLHGVIMPGWRADLKLGPGVDIIFSFGYT